ncbi:cadherin-like beta sandwich domain-containing protein [Clostridium uliginosum]|uniref:cadherin-like beta sandwich domain-containing protein n=1 Tax=Clostridium uliginosum TaxID=119641 RepID=UPI001FA8D2B7|nr:cadherin-like beta sandwich domain-containing protein [Clostridium uliginosum]
MAINKKMKMNFKRVISQLLIFALMITTVQIGNIKGANAIDLDLGFTASSNGNNIAINKIDSNYQTDEIDMSVSTINIKSSGTSYYKIEEVTSSSSGVTVINSGSGSNTSAKIVITQYNDFYATIKVKDLGTNEIKSYNVKFKFSEDNSDAFKFDTIDVACGTGYSTHIGVDYKDSDPDTGDYALSNLPDNIDNVKVSILDANAKPITSGVQITMNGSSSNFKLVGGDNKVIIKRTVNGHTKVFNLILSKKGSATLKSLTGVTLSPSFNSDTTEYTVNVPTTQTTVTLNPTATDNSSTIKVNGVIVRSGTNSQAISLKEGRNNIVVKVTTPDGQASAYNVEVNRAEAPRSSCLKSLTINSAPLAPGFNKDTYEYTSSVDNKVTAVTVTPTAEFATSTLKVNGKSVANGGTTGFISLDEGSNDIDIQVTDVKGDTTDYKVTVTRRYGKDNVRLGSLKTTEGTLSPKFDPETYLYTVKVDRAVSKLKIVFAAQNDKAVVKVEDKEYASAQQSDYIDLKIGANLVNINVVAEDKKTTTNYKVSIIRDKVEAVNEWVLAGDAWTFYDATGTQVKNRWVKYDNNWYFVNVSGYREENGWILESNKWYYLNPDGTMKTGWYKGNGYWYYLQGDGSMKSSGWGQYDKEWYMLNENGMMQTGWILRDGYYYYLQDSGVMKKGWQYYDKNWYYLNDDGTMRRGWLYTGKEFYYLDYSGYAKMGWQYIDGIWYYFDYSGKMKTGNLFLDGKWYYLNSDGSLQ